MRFIGDVHGEFNIYKTLISDTTNSIQVGDFGVGFGEDIPDISLNHRFIRGNHDNPALCKTCPNWIPDGHIENDIMYIGGAFSVDHEYRIMGVDWWPEEELSIGEFYEIYDKIVALETKPRIMVTHDLPFSVAPHVFGTRKQYIQNRTNTMMQAIFEIHRPEIWIFGHWHQRHDINILGTRFICLDMLRRNSSDQRAAIFDIDI